MPHFYGFFLHLSGYVNQQRLPKFLLAYIEAQFRHHELKPNSLDRDVHRAAPGFVVLANFRHYFSEQALIFVLFALRPLHFNS